VRRILLKGAYGGQRAVKATGEPEALVRLIATGSLDARQALSAYSKLLHGRLGSFEQVARVMRLDWRTVKKYVSQA
jgi:hypothetical protein